MPKQRVLKNRNGEQQPQQQEQHVGKGQQQSMLTNGLQQQPPRKMTITVKKGGQPKEYHYQTTVNSFEELDKFRFQVFNSKIINNMKNAKFFPRIIAIFLLLSTDYLLL
jgi:hypothetical protein